MRTAQRWKLAVEFHTGWLLSQTHDEDFALLVSTVDWLQTEYGMTHI